MRLFTNILLAMMCVTTTYAQLPEVSTGKLHRIENFESKYIQPRNIDIWLPSEYDERNRYPVLYMHDGQMLFDDQSTWNKQAWDIDDAIGQLAKQDKVKNCIVVGIWNSGQQRYNEYYPQKPLRSMIKSRDIPAPFKIKSDLYLKFIVQELKPYIDRHFKTKKSRKYTYMMGAGMGGLISIYAICEYPKIFGAVASLSTSWTHNRIMQYHAYLMDYLKAHLPSPKSHKIYFDYGTKTLNPNYSEYQKQVDMLMLQSGYSAKNWTTKSFKTENYSEKTWGKRVHIPLRFLFSR